MHGPSVRGGPRAGLPEWGEGQTGPKGSDRSRGGWLLVTPPAVAGVGVTTLAAQASAGAD
jgi:hypothetical protein